MLNFLEGKKTYTLAIVAVLTGLTAYISGTADVMAAIQIALVGGVAATLRHAITTATGSSVLADAVVDAVSNVVAEKVKVEVTETK